MKFPHPFLEQRSKEETLNPSLKCKIQQDKESRFLSDDVHWEFKEKSRSQPEIPGSESEEEDIDSIMSFALHPARATGTVVNYATSDGTKLNNVAFAKLPYKLDMPLQGT